VMIAGLMLYMNQPWWLLALVPVATMQVVRARREASVLEQQFGDAYRAYRARTWF
jgi:protein-S-isoprenylcysteine O-methyltransferase Ste14